MIKTLFLQTVLILLSLSFSYSQDNEVLKIVAKESCGCIEEINLDTLNYLEINNALATCYLNTAEQYRDQIYEKYKTSLNTYEYGVEHPVGSIYFMYLSQECPSFNKRKNIIDQKFLSYQRLERIYNENVIYLYGRRFYKNGNLINRSLLEDEFKDTKSAYMEYNRSRSAKLMAGSFLTAGIISGIYGVIQLGSGDVPTGVVGAVAFTVVSIPFRIKARKREEKAVYLRNREILLKKL